MGPVDIYALALIGTFLLMICRCASEAVPPLLEFVQRISDKYLRLPYVIEPNRWIGGRTRLAVLRQAAIVAVSLCAVFLETGNAGSLTERAGYVSMVQMAPCYLAVHMSYAADLLCMQLSTFRTLHIEFGSALVLSTTIHIISARRVLTQLVWTDDRSRYGVISASILAFLIVLCAVYLRRWSYEFFLRIHQLLAAGMWFALWRHVSSTTTPAKWYALGIVIPPGVMTILQVLQVLIRHRFFYYGTPKARIRTAGYSTSVFVFSPVSIKYRAGQYINLYIPGMGIRSAFESHPFTVVAVTDEDPGQCCQLMVKPSRGWSRRLLERAERFGTKDSCNTAFFSGPHGRPISLNEYGTVVLVASRWGIMAQLPYLEHLIQSSHNSCTKVRKACLIWQLDHIDQGAPVRELLNHALRQDSLRDRYIISVLIFHRHGDIDSSQQEMGHHHRLAFFKGDANWKDLIGSQVFEQRHTLPKPLTLTEVTGPAEGMYFALRQTLPRTLVMVSADRRTRRTVRKVVYDLIDSRVELSELEYQPEA